MRIGRAVSRQVFETAGGARRAVAARFAAAVLERPLL
jgi:hypothetical protein